MRDLQEIEILYREDVTMSLWGIPARVNSPKEISPENRQGWLWFGAPGWWGNKTSKEIADIERFLSTCWAIPEHPGEWLYVKG